MRFTRRTAVVAGAAVVVLSTGAWAAIPGPDGEISGCFNRVNGALRVVDAGASCRATETAIGWSRRGPEGPQGERGPTGPAGPAGTAAPVHAVSDTYGFDADGLHDTHGPDVPAGRYLMTATAMFRTTWGNSSGDVLCAADPIGGGTPMVDSASFDRGAGDEGHALHWERAGHHPGGQIGLVRCRLANLSEGNVGFEVTITATPLD